MARCLMQYSDPAGRDGSRMCGRLVGHKGSHAWQGFDGSWALWTPAGALIMAAEFGAPPATEKVERELSEEEDE